MVYGNDYSPFSAQYKYADMATSDVFSLYKNFKSLKPQDAKPYGVYIRNTCTHTITVGVFILFSAQQWQQGNVRSSSWDYSCEDKR